jgi:hypothetical protein
MNDEVEVTVFQAMIQVDFTVVNNSHLSVRIRCLKVMFSIGLSVNTSSNVFSKLVGHGHSLQSQKKTICLRWIANYS